MQKRQAVLILGGTSGLGRDLIERSWLSGALPVVLGRDLDKIRHDPGLREMIMLEVDLTQPRVFVAEDYLEIERLASQLDFTHIFWVAGIPQVKAFLDMTSSEVAELIQVHFEGPVRVLHTLLRVLPKKPIHLVTVTTIATLTAGLQGKGLYRSLKRAKEDVTRLLLDDLPGSFASIFHLAPMATSFRQQIGVRPDQVLLDPSNVAKVMVLATGVGFGPTRRFVFPPYTDSHIVPACTYQIEPDPKDSEALILRQISPPFCSSP